MGEGLDIHTIQKIIGYPSDLKFTGVEEETFKCLDGRTNGEYLGCPGGEAGEFILGLHVYSKTMLNFETPTPGRIVRIRYHKG